MKRTKILATVGPASESEEVLAKLFEAGLDAARCNFSHGTADDHRKRVKLIREVAKKNGHKVGILGDLQGPKIRIARFKDNKVILTKGQEFILDADMDLESGDKDKIGIDYPTLPDEVDSGDVLLLDDGKIVFHVKKVEGQKVICEVVVAGPLSNNKGINKQGGGLSAKALTEKDKEDLITAAEIGVNFLALSFVRNAEDMNEARALLDAQGAQHIGIIAKIERLEALDHLDEIIEAGDGVMVARGDLAVEIGPERVPGVQKYLIKRCRDLNKIAITATQMLESMIDAPTPTRAEVSDVANAVLDGTDMVMLSAESATGDYPVEAVGYMSKIILATEESPITHQSKHRMDSKFKRADETIAMATMYTANHFNVKAIISLTESGSSVLWMSRIRSHLPIFALIRNPEVEGKVNFYRGVFPVSFDSTKMNKEDVNISAVKVLEDLNVLTKGDFAILTSGDHMGIKGGTNKMKIIRVGDVV
jgi:pyruvate kinase